MMASLVPTFLKPGWELVWLREEAELQWGSWLLLAAVTTYLSHPTTTSRVFSRAAILSCSFAPLLCFASHLQGRRLSFLCTARQHAAGSASCLLSTSKPLQQQLRQLQPLRMCVCGAGALESPEVRQHSPSGLVAWCWSMFMADGICRELR